MPIKCLLGLLLSTLLVETFEQYTVVLALMSETSLSVLSSFMSVYLYNLSQTHFSGFCVGRQRTVNWKLTFCYV